MAETGARAARTVARASPSRSGLRMPMPPSGSAEGTEYKALQEHMNQVGTCKRAQIMTKGTGFAWMSSAEEASNAILQLNGSELNGATLVVDVWTKKEKSS